MIDPWKYGTVTEAAEAASVGRTGLHAAIRRRDKELVVVKTFGGTTLVNISSVRRWANVARQPGPKPQ